MAHNLARSQGLVFHAIEQGLVVARPDHIARRAGDGLTNQLARFQVFDINGIDTATHGIDRIGQQLVVLAKAKLANLKEGMAFGQHIAIE